MHKLASPVASLNSSVSSGLRGRFLLGLIVLVGELYLEARSSWQLGFSRDKKGYSKKPRSAPIGRRHSSTWESDKLETRGQF